MRSSLNFFPYVCDEVSVYRYNGSGAELVQFFYFFFRISFQVGVYPTTQPEVG